MNVKFFDLKVKNNNTKKLLNSSFNKLLSHGQFFLGPEVSKFEKKVAKFLGVKYSVAVGSGSSALYLALKSCGIGKGDEVITTPLTWIITVHAIAACGAKPVFIDVRDDFNINPNLIQKKITKKTKAIVPMHYAGMPCAMDKITKIAKKNNIIVIEDAAQAFGAEYKGKKIGSFSTVGSFSMNPMKPLAGYGEGGAVVTNNKKIFEELKILRHAGTVSDYKKTITNYCKYVSLNHKMDSLNASLLLVALKQFNKKNSLKEKIFKRYKEKLSKQVVLPSISKNSIHGKYVFPIIVKKRDKLKKFLENKKIETKIFNLPLANETPIYSKYNYNDTPNAKRLVNSSLVIPSHEKLTLKQVDYVIETINKFYS